MENKLQTLAGCSIFEQHVLDYCYTIGSYKRRVYEYDVWFIWFDLIFPVMFLLIFGIILFTFISGIRTWNKNNNSPRLTVEARVTAKRQNTTHHNEPVGGDTSGTHGYHTTTSTSYCVAFDVESGDRMEFSVYGEEYGMLAEGDEEKLIFQGSRYLGFERAIEN